MSDRETEAFFDAQRYVDGEMPPGEIEAFEARMSSEPDLADQVAEIMAMDTALRATVPSPSAAHLDDILTSAEAAVITPRRSIPWRQLAAAVALVAFGFGSGLLSARSSVPTDLTGDLLANASAAHALYSVEVVHPVEVSAGKRDHLKGWLSNRLGAEVRIPELTGQGLSLVGGRLLPFEQGAAAQFMYENTDGTRLTLYLTPDTQEAKTALRFGAAEALSVVYWQDGLWHYALVGPLDKAQMTGIAQSVQGALF